MVKKSAKKIVGKVYLVGAGPGHPDLITVRGTRCLMCADVILYDHLASPQLLSYAKPGAELIYLGKEAGNHTLAQGDMNKLLVKKAMSGLTVARLKGGDPFIFGRGGEEAEELRKAGVRFEIVPGITSGIAAPAFAGIPVTFRKMASSVALITGHEDPDKPDSSIRWEYLARGVDTLVFYMGVGNLKSITLRLIENGRPATTPVALVQWGTLPRQRTVTGTLATIESKAKKAGLTPPCIIVVGEVVKARTQLNWFESLPLFGRRIINTRSRAQASEFSVQLQDKGAEVLELPTIEIQPVEPDSPLARETDHLSGYDWILFTSPNGVRVFFDLLLHRQGDVRVLGNVSIGSIGPGTSQELERFHVKPTVTAKEAVAEGLLRVLKEHGPWKDKNILIPRAQEARDVLPETLKKWGARVNIFTAYKTVKPKGKDAEILSLIEDGKYDLITFSSSSTFENFAALLGPARMKKIKKGLKAASIGPVTTSAIRKAGIKPKLEARDHTIPGLVRAIEGYLS